MADIFTWSPNYNARVTRKPRIKSAKFGDGYEQRQLDGLNPNLERWTVSFANRPKEEIADIDAFLLNLGGVDYFNWLAPGNVNASNYICREWDKSITGPYTASLEATFEEVADA